MDVPECVEPAETSSDNKALATEPVASIVGIGPVRSPEPGARSPTGAASIHGAKDRDRPDRAGRGNRRTSGRSRAGRGSGSRHRKSAARAGRNGARGRPAPAAPRPKAAKPASRKRRARPAPKDDWQFFDPEETRFAALLAKLDEITGTDAARHS